MSNNIQNEVVKAKARNGKGIMIGSDWYNVRDTDKLSSLSKGDTVSFSWEQNGNFKNITSDIKVEATAAAATSSQSSGGSRSYGGGGGRNDPEVQAAIIRQNALTNAVNYAVGMDHAGQGTEYIIDIARIFESYTANKPIEMEAEDDDNFNVE